MRAPTPLQRGSKPTRGLKRQHRGAVGQSWWAQLHEARLELGQREAQEQRMVERDV